MEARHDTCRVCGAESGFAFTLPLLHSPVDYFDCQRCGCLQTEMPHWLETAYSSAINVVDTGIMVRNRQNVGRVVATLLALGKAHGRVLDHAGGYGILVRMLRDVGVDALWQDKYCDNLLARGFEADDGPFDLLTAFEAFEHFVHPLDELRTMLTRAPHVLLSTELIKTEHAPPNGWWYYGAEHGQHVSFYRAQTLHWMAATLGCHVDTDGQSLHLFSKHSIPRRWRILVSLRRIGALAPRLLLRSKTMADFTALRARPTRDAR
jgi:hypothetical protein